MAKTASNQLGICLRIMHVQRMPKVSIFMAVTTKIVPEKAQKWPKMAKIFLGFKSNCLDLCAFVANLALPRLRAFWWAVLAETWRQGAQKHFIGPGS